MCLGVDAQTGGPSFPVRKKKKSDCTIGVRTPLAVYPHKGFCYEVYSPCNVIIQFILVGKSASKSEIYMAVEHKMCQYVFNVVLFYTFCLFFFIIKKGFLNMYLLFTLFKEPFVGFLPNEIKFCGKGAIHKVETLPRFDS